MVFSRRIKTLPFTVCFPNFCFLFTYLFRFFICWFWYYCSSLIYSFVLTSFAIWCQPFRNLYLILCMVEGFGVVLWFPCFNLKFRSVSSYFWDLGLVLFLISFKWASPKMGRKGERYLFKVWVISQRGTIFLMMMMIYLSKRDYCYLPPSQHAFSLGHS